MNTFTREEAAWILKIAQAMTTQAPAEFEGMLWLKHVPGENCKTEVTIESSGKISVVAYYGASEHANDVRSWPSTREFAKDFEVG